MAKPFFLGDPVGVRLSRPRGGWTVDHFAPKRGDNGESLAYGILHDACDKNDEMTRLYWSLVDSTTEEVPSLYDAKDHSPDVVAAVARWRKANKSKVDIWAQMEKITEKVNKDAIATTAPATTGRSKCCSCRATIKKNEPRTSISSVDYGEFYNYFQEVTGRAVCGNPKWPGFKTSHYHADCSPVAIKAAKVVKAKKVGVKRKR